MADEEMTNDRNADRIAGLLEELRGYEARGLTERATAVRAALKELDVTVGKDGTAKLPKNVEKAVAEHNEPAIETAVNDGGK